MIHFFHVATIAHLRFNQSYGEKGCTSRFWKCFARHSNDTETGFAKIEGKKISKDIENLLVIENPEISLVLAHNFIEAGVDFNLRDMHPEIFDIYSRSFQEVDLQKITELLSKYLKIEKEKVAKELQNFIGFLGPKHFSSIGELIHGVIIPLIEIKFGKVVGPNEVKRILLIAKEITRNNFMKFLNNAVEKIKVDFSTIILK